jgi:Zn-finger nucleic acid-binding protein
VLCPNCQAPTITEKLDAHLGRSVEVDLCLSCQLFWFDQGENLQLSPRATLTLFRIIGEHGNRRGQPLAVVLKCPRCSAGLRLTHDRQRNVAFRYLRCPHGHGRLTTFFDFLREKNVVRPLDAGQIAELRKNVQAVNCTNCGAPIDLAHGSSCSHCGSPLSIVDLNQAGDIIKQLRRADRSMAPPDPLLPLRLAEARREVEHAFAAAGHAPQKVDPLSIDALEAGLSMLASWLKK